MVDNADTSSSTKCHSESEALAPAATSKRNAINQASAAQSLTSETSETCTPSLKGTKMNNLEDVKAGEACFALALPNSKRGLQMDQNSSIRPSKFKVHGKKHACKRRVGSSGCVKRFNPRCESYGAVIRFDSIEMLTGSRDLKTSLDYLLILIAVKQKMENHTGAGTFVERLQAALGSCAAEHGCNLADFKLSFNVVQNAGCFMGSCQLRSPSVRSLEVFGKMRSVLDPFRQYAKNLGNHNVYWQFSPVHLEDAWERFQSAVARAWEVAGVDSTAILQKICCLYEAQAPFRIANLKRWEQQHMARQDKHKHRPRHLQERNPTASLECWERRQMAMEDKNQHRPKKLRQKLDLRKCASESALSRQLSSLRKLIARWGHMLKRDSEKNQQRQRVLHQQRAQQKKDQEERRRLQVVKQKQRREEERLRREWVRKRMRTDPLTMDDILGQKKSVILIRKVYTIGEHVGGDGSCMLQRCFF